MGRLNTAKLLKQCQKMQAAQTAKQAAEALTETTTSLAQLVEGMSALKGPFEVEAELDKLAPIDLIEYLADFLEICKEAKTEYQKAVDDEYLPNASIQDVLHAAESAPSLLASIDVVEVLHVLRTERREAKKNLEITDLFQQWAEKNVKATRELSEIVGQMRKIARRQPSDFYAWKTDLLGEKGAHMVMDDKEETE